MVLLRHHLLEGRLDMDEYADRVGAAYAAATSDDLDAVMIDLPPLPVDVAPSANHRHGEVDAPAITWRPTRERFRDPSTGRIMRVWIDPGDGRRHYVAE